MGTVFDFRHNMMRCSDPAASLILIARFLTLSLFAVMGCAMMAKPPTDAVLSAELTLRAAAEARADKFAPMDLQKARESLAASKEAIADGKYDEARRLAEIAQVEAELAEAKAEAEITRLAADKLRHRTDALREEIKSRLRRESATAAPKE